jgi:hypothetical protein
VRCANLQCSLSPETFWRPRSRYLGRVGTFASNARGLKIVVSSRRKLHPGTIQLLRRYFDSAEPSIADVDLRRARAPMFAYLAAMKNSFPQYAPCLQENDSSSPGRLRGARLRIVMMISVINAFSLLKHAFTDCLFERHLDTVAPRFSSEWSHR